MYSLSEHPLTETHIINEISEISQFYIDSPGKKVFRSSGEDVVPLTLMVYAPTDDPTSWDVFCLSASARESLLVRLVMFGELTDAFERVYPEDEQATDFSVQIWRIHYPVNVRINCTWSVALP